MFITYYLIVHTIEFFYSLSDIVITATEEVMREEGLDESASQLVDRQLNWWSATYNNKT